MWLVLIPIACFAAAFLFGAVGLWHVAKRTRISQTETQAGKALHVESPLGTLDVHPEPNLDPRLAKIPAYPGAMRLHPSSADEVTDLHYGHTTLEEVSATYWTPDAEKTVWDFYRRELPDWPRNLDESVGQELIHPAADGVRLIRVTGRKDRTIIETCIKPPGYPHHFSDSADE